MSESKKIAKALYDMKKAEEDSPIPKRPECQVYYKADGINEKLDAALEKVLKDFGYTRWASGYTFDTKIRDLAFEAEITKSKEE